MMPETAQNPVSVILPAYNEEAAVGPQVEAIRRVLCSEGIPHEVIVIDDGSVDRTVEAALQARARVLRHVENRGYGAAIKTGILAAHYDIIVMLDADGTYPSDQIPGLIAQLDTADMAVGARIGEHVHVSWLRELPKMLLRWLAIWIAGQTIPDLNSGLRAFRRECVIQYFPILSNRFSFTTTLTLALLADEYRVVYYPVDYYRRIGKSKVKPRGVMDFIILILRMSMVFQPLKVFVPLAFACGLAGVLKVAFDIVGLFERHSSIGWSLMFEHVLSTSAVLLLTAGFQLLLIGMVADGMVRRIAQHNRPLAPSHGVRAYESAPDRQNNA